VPRGSGVSLTSRLSVCGEELGQDLDEVVIVSQERLELARLLRPEQGMQQSAVVPDAIAKRIFAETADFCGPGTMKSLPRNDTFTMPSGTDSSSDG
jgi:hypothetical protein